MDARRLVGVVTACGLLAWSAAAAAQQATGTISGVTRDTTGAVIPGVTVEAASPALIEKVRSTVTDDQGRYQALTLDRDMRVAISNRGYFVNGRRIGTPPVPAREDLLGPVCRLALPMRVE